MLRSTPALLAAVLTAAALAGCTGPAPEPAPEPEPLQVVASTNVYADIAGVTGGEYVEVTTVIDDPAQNPHGFLPAPDDPRLTAAFDKADVVIINGGGYDDTLLDMLEASGNTDAIVIEAADLIGRDTDAPDFDPHVWYNYEVMTGVVFRLADAYARLDPEHDFAYSTKSEIAVHWLGLLGRNAATLNDTVEGMTAVVTDRAPVYLLDHLKMVNLTPLEYSQAIEQGANVPPELQQRVLDLLGGGSVDVVMYNPQTGGPATEAVLAAAAANGIPAIAASETTPGDVEALDDDFDSRYIWWQADILGQVRSSLEAP